MADAVLTLPEALRSELKEPLGELYTDAEALLAAAGAGDGAPAGPLIAVGDAVTYHLLSAGRPPTVAVVDEKTERAAVDDDVRETLRAAREDAYDGVLEVENAPATLSAELLSTITAALERAPATTMITVDGEEDLAALPAILAAPEDGAVVYGQPDEGMVLVAVDADLRGQVRDLLSRMDGDVDRALDLLSV